VRAADCPEGGGRVERTSEGFMERSDGTVLGCGFPKPKIWRGFGKG